MKILLVTRGSQGDVLPYLAVAEELRRRGHEVTLNVPSLFEASVKSYGFRYVLQPFDDIKGMIDDAGQKKQGFRPFLKWTRAVIDTQFEQLPSLVKQHDLVISTNSEFAAPSIAEYCEKPLIRTGYAPLLPSKHIRPATLPFQRPNPLLPPALLWKVMNRLTNLMVKETINKQRQQLGMTPIVNFGYHAGSHSLNYLMYSPQIGETDPDWPFPWEIGGYCFNDSFSYEEPAYQTLLRFVESGSDPILFFTLGSCSAKDGHRFCQMLLESCRKLGFRLLIGSGWSQTGIQLQTNDRLFLITQPLPHHLLLSHCQGVIHHGGCGTTHSVARAGKPQLLTPLLLDQPYWAYRVERLGIGPSALRIGKATQREVDRKVEQLMTDSNLQRQAEQLGQKIRAEQGVCHLCDYIEQTKGTYSYTK